MRVFAFSLACMAAPLAAADLDCENAMTQLDMNRCAHQAYLLADEDLNLAYKMAKDMARVADEYLEEGQEPAVIILRDAQRAWITFRDKACELESTMFRGGSMAPLIYSSCLERETRARTDSLRFYAEVN
ncbi:MAG: DUF1311 domain-containing protein [Cognatishimia sp.]|uniref:lysozyme inhibitor LprI family protein n=1 Tax=Cognatishimia sp. TaxID=2211648 RepID=UPI003B8E1B82